jgi:hypothetical protein
VVDTNTSYRLISRDIGKSLERVEKQPIVQRATEYFMANIGKVKSAKEFVDNHRLFNYAMKAFGMEDMAYAKAFMLKALKEGVSDPDSFANKLADKRYAEFVSFFNFAAHGEKTTSYNLARDATTINFTKRVTLDGTIPEPEIHKKNTAYFSEKIVKVKSIEDLLVDDRVLSYALYAYGLETAGLSEAELRKYLEGGVADPDSPANKHPNKNIARFVTSFNFAEMGEQTTTHIPAQQGTALRYMRQTLEEDAGTQNEGVRLALYFERKAETLTNAYQVLADPALSTVLRTLLSLPDSIAQLDVDKQAKLLESKIDFADFQDPEKLTKLIGRFTTMWEMNNPTATPQSLLVSLFQPVDYGISQNTMMAIAMLKR